MNRTMKLVTLCAATLAAVALYTVTSGATAQAAPPSDDEVVATGVVNINTATEEQLQLLPGVGPSKAAAIVAYRKRHGNFKKVDDLRRVKGFGAKTLKKLKPYLSVSGPTTYKGKKAPGDDGLAGRPPAMD